MSSEQCDCQAMPTYDTQCLQNVTHEAAPSGSDLANWVVNWLYCVEWHHTVFARSEYCIVSVRSAIRAQAVYFLHLTMPSVKCCKTCPTGNRWNCALFIWPKKFRLPLKLSLLGESRPKSTRTSPQQCAHSALNFIQIGSLSAEL